eukprot:TRINITY_DN2723_c1_g1_i4.p1 TRINITY_DN2723_c1_g1~~TRINITY_DN2723_c1_g1_i4.p1  ORF type:complete len:517 (-),score=201.63 TRINITY_DN2723_c1_g1_i4:49-1599(-)
MGRTKSLCQIHLPDPNRMVSGQHCRFLKRNEKPCLVFVEDLSSNGTFVNKVKVGKGNSLVIKNGDEITIIQERKDEPALSYIFKDLKKNQEESTVMTDEGPFKDYEILESLGSGNFAVVKLGIQKKTGKKVAIKIIDKKKHLRQTSARKAQEALMDEVEILKSVSHPNIIGIEDVYDTQSTLYIVLELVTGGELFDVLADKGKFDEHFSKKLFSQMVDAVDYLHEREIVHRDLKPENILFSDKNLNMVKLSDFGLSRKIRDGSVMQTLCGTPQYIAPEILVNQEQKGYGNKVDCWSLGAILYILLSGDPPFDQEASMQMFGRNAKVNGTPVQFNAPIWSTISDEAKDLIICLLTVDPASRYSIKETQKHPWLSGTSLQALLKKRNIQDSLKQRVLEDEKKKMEEEELLEKERLKKEEDERIEKEVAKRLKQMEEAASSDPEKKRRIGTVELDNEGEPALKKSGSPSSLSPSFDKASLEEEEEEEETKPLCKYGVKCYRKNSQHLKEFRHVRNDHDV